MIHHVTLELRVADVAGCVAFYEALDFHEVAPPAALAATTVWLQRTTAPDQIHLMHGGAEDPDEAGKDPRPRTGHFALVCPDYDDTLARLRADGHTVEPHREYWGSPRSFVRDPVGNLIELMAWRPSRRGGRRPWRRGGRRPRRGDRHRLRRPGGRRSLG
jgi:catechol 2,3-dioxygenase-like lactoylglutathione lyase family enzyme